MRTGDDVDVVAHRHLGNVAAQTRGVFGQALDRLDGGEFLLLEAQQHEREQFGKDDEVRLVIACDIDEIFDGAHEFVIVRDRAGLQLAGRDAHRLDSAWQPLLHRLVALDIRVAPDHHHRIGHRGFVFGQIALHDPFGFEAVGQLEAQHRIVQFPLDHLGEIVLRIFDLAAEAAIVGHPPGKDDTRQVHFFGQRASFFIQAPPDAHAADLGIDAHLVAIEPVAGRIVTAAIAIAGDLVPVMRLEGERFGKLHGCAIADDLVIE